jgi:hypothetical protein
MPHIKEVLSESHELQEAMPAAAAQKREISIVVPVMNEEQNVRLLYEALSPQLKEL